MHKVIEKLLPTSYFLEIKNLVDSDNFPWFWQNDQINGYKLDASAFGFSHTLFKDGEIKSDAFALFKPIVHIFEEKCNLKVKDVFRMQLNLMTRTQEFEIEQSNHMDINMPNYTSFILYLDHADGDTVIENEHKVTPMDNRCVFFKSTTIHRATPPQESKKRMVLNVVLETYE